MSTFLSAARDYAQSANLWINQREGPQSVEQALEAATVCALIAIAEELTRANDLAEWEVPVQEMPDNTR